MSDTYEPGGPGDPFQLVRFLDAQERVYEYALREIKAARKRTHWMWFIFPQFAGLGHSSVSQHYAIKSIDEARAYLAHPVLGMRLRECVGVLLRIENETASRIFGYPDDLKLCSCATLFAAISPNGSIFHQLIDKYFAGKSDQNTLRLLQHSR